MVRMLGGVASVGDVREVPRRRERLRRMGGRMCTIFGASLETGNFEIVRNLTRGLGLAYRVLEEHAFRNKILI